MKSANKNAPAIFSAIALATLHKIPAAPGS